MKSKLLKKIKKRYEWKFNYDFVMVYDKNKNDVRRFNSIKESIYLKMGRVCYGFFELSKLEIKKNNKLEVANFKKL